MSDVYATIGAASPDMQHRLAGILELRASEAKQRQMLDDYLRVVEPLVRGEAVVLEVGAGTGAVSRFLATRPWVAEVVGLDPSRVFLDEAERRSREFTNLRFVEGDARDLAFPDAMFDLAVAHTCICHVPSPERVIAEMKRVLRPGGVLAVFEGDYAHTSVALSRDDPLQACVEAALAALVYDPWIGRRLSALARRAGMSVHAVHGHSYVVCDEDGYLVTFVDRGADALVDQGRLGAVAGEALKKEARIRLASGTFYGYIPYVSMIAVRPDRGEHEATAPQHELDGIAAAVI